MDIDEKIVFDLIKKNTYKQFNDINDNIIYEDFEPKNYNKLYSKLKEKLGIQNYIRKLDFDSSLKKIKAKIFKAIHFCLRACIRENFIIKRLPQSFIVDIRIDSNKKIFDLTINEIYNSYCIDINYEKLLIDNLIKSDKILLLKSFLTSKFLDVLNFYRRSKQYLRDKNRFIKINKNKNFGIILDYTIDNYENYFNSKVGNKKLKRKKFNFKVINVDDINK
jgi:hypothetical protein